MKEMLSIGEFARLRHTTVETLRHYDRIGLLKPVKVNPETGYRYYSILQYEELGTIMELRQLGMSIDEIKKYFENRNLEQAVDMLKEKYVDLGAKIRELQELEKIIGEKIKHLQDISKVTDFEKIEIKVIEERTILTFNRSVKNEIDLGYACLELENALKEVAPIVASNRYGTFVKETDRLIEESTGYESVFLFVKDRENIDKNLVTKLPKGLYACMYYDGHVSGIEACLEKMNAFLKRKGYHTCGDFLQILQLDTSVTGKSVEGLFEIQVRIKKH